MSETARPLIIAHRGASAVAPENTLTAFLLAFMQGADGVAADIRMSADGHLVAVHDEDTKRVAGLTLKVEKTSLKDLRALDVGKVFSRRGQGQRMPSVEEVLSMLPSGKLLHLNFKLGVEGVPALVRVLSLPENLEKNVVVVSPDVRVLAAVNASLPKVAKMLSSERRWSKKNRCWMPETEMLAVAAQTVGAKAVSLDARSVVAEPEVVQELLNRGLKIDVWTVNRAPSAARMARIGVASITTDYPGHLVESFAKGSLAKVESEPMSLCA